jgi:enterochelin esterase family protein
MKHLFLLVTLCGTSLLRSQDTNLHEYLVEGRGWEVAADGFAFTDGLCCDENGHLYFTDVKEGEGIYRVDAGTGKVNLFLKDLPGISGLQMGPDGRFYACQNRMKRVIAVSRKGEIEELLTDIKCNDLVVTRRGFVYVTETPTKRIHLVTPERKHVIVDEGNVTRPNGITVSADERTLIVSDHGGKHVWAWEIGEEGLLVAAAPFMTMWLPVGEDEAKGDGATTEEKGRYFVTTSLGVQIFDPAGRLAGIIAMPEPDGKVVSVEFAGPDHDILFVAAGERIYRRQLKVRGHF